MATIGILQERSSRRRDLLARQLQSALTSRVVIEQAKGVIAERCGLHVRRGVRADAGYARSRNAKLSEVAGRVVARELDLGASHRTPSDHPPGT